MLEYMHVRNLALIKECEISFGKGLNILTGETGAGKSILLGSINLALGGKADKDIIRTGEEEAYVELVFSASDYVKNLISEMELSCEDDNVIISRKITPTKNVFKINGEIVTGKLVKELAGGLLDVHGQHEHQSLLSVLKQRDMLDAYGSEPVAELLKKVSAAASEYNKVKEILEESLSMATGREREINLLRYEVEEISNAELKIGEDEELEESYKRMKSAEKLLSLTNEALSCVSSGIEGDAGSLISRAINNMRKASSIDEESEKLCTLLTDAEGILGDFAMEASSYLESLEFSEEEFLRTEERLNVINSLKLKFGKTIEDILTYLDEKSKELEKLEHLDEYLEKLKKDTEAALFEYKKCALELSELRKKTAKEFEKNLSKELLTLSFNDANFRISFDTDENLVNSKGMDKIEFLISTNPGEPVKPMKDVASGGELSRIMLAIKTILASKDDVDALIFDEIDSGISGKTAWEVSGRLKKLSTEHQVIAITHLAQIAAMADSHFEIKKTVASGNTVTTIHKLDEEGEINELARLLGTDEESKATLDNAKELKKKAKERLV